MTYQEAVELQDKLLTEAIDAGSAVNLSGLINSLARATESLWAIAREFGYDQSWVNNHLVIREYIDAIYWLNRSNESKQPMYSTLDSYKRNYKEVKHE